MQRTSQGLDIDQRNIPFSAFNSADVVAVQPCPDRKLGLTKLQLQPQFANRVAEDCLWIWVHGGRDTNPAHSEFAMGKYTLEWAGRFVRVTAKLLRP
ncbi:MAG: hypothetical protein JWN74_2303 [Acidobacteriaceae bacterium]|nr:hypothetical protein [Acidobacteriaceae bacterium]